MEVARSKQTEPSRSPNEHNAGLPSVHPNQPMLNEATASLPTPMPNSLRPTSPEGPQRIVYAWSHNEAVFPGETYSPAQYIRSFALIHLRYLERRCLSWPQLLSSSILPRHQFHPMYVAYRAVLRSGGSDKGLDLYLAFTNVISEYGFRMDPAHTIIDWHLIGSRLGLTTPDEIDSLKSVYYDRVAPLVAVWLTEVKLVMMSLDFDAEYNDSELHSGFPFPTRKDISHLTKGLASIAEILRLSETSKTISETHLLADAMGTGLDNWLLNIADNELTRLVACQLQGKLCRLLLDWIYRVMSSLDEPILQNPALFRLYIALIRTSGDFPTQLWVSLDRQPRFGFPRHGGGFVLIDAHLRGRASTVCTPIFNEEWQMTPTLHQDFWGGIAVLSVLRHPRLMPLRGVTSMPSVAFSPAHRVAFVLPNIPDVHYFYPFTGPPCGYIDSVMKQIASSLAYLHELGIVHGDLTWQNIILHPDNTVSIWNLGFNRESFDETVEAYINPYLPHLRNTDGIPTVADDISSCGRIFLSLAVSVRGSRAAPSTNEQGGIILHKHNMSTRNSPRPEMPHSFGDVDYLTPAQRELLWQLVTDMTRVSIAPDISMTDVVDRLGSIFNQ